MPRRIPAFVPILAGATLRERLIACAGALFGIGLTTVISGLVMHGAYLPTIVAPMGASAVLVFAVPTSPLAQPWSVIGGNTLSALVGVTASHYIDERAIAAAVAVSLAIFVMSFTRSLHPPGGAAALVAVLGGPVVQAAGWQFPLAPVALNSMLLVGVGLLAHKLSGRAYPHRPAPMTINTHQTDDPPAQLRVGFHEEDIDAALRVMHETFDVAREDVAVLLREVELQAAVRSAGPLRCGDIMARDVVKIAASDDVETARSLLTVHDIRVLPVIGDADELVGIVGFRELMLAGGPVAAHATTAPTASIDDPAIGLTRVLTDGSSHAVVIVDGERRVVGLVTQTDLLAAMLRTLSRRAAAYTR
jgi:CBS domain-containing membrane protein